MSFFLKFFSPFKIDSFLISILKKLDPCSRGGSYLAVTASQIQHHLVSTLLGFHTSKLQKKYSKFGAVGIRP